MKFKKLLMFLLVAFVAVGFAGCIQTTEETTTEATTTEATTTEAVTTTEATTTEEATTTTEEPVDLEALIQELQTAYADTLDSETFLATEDLELLATIGGLEISWSSNNQTYLEDDGTVHRPTFSEGDQTVILTASVTYGDDTEDYMFFVTIQALPKSDQERADEVFIVVTAFPNKEFWTSADNDDLDFLTEGQDADQVTYTVTWTSSHPEIISTAGEITQPEGDDVVVTMTATITIGGVDYSTTVDFTVAAMEEGVECATIAEAIALGEDTYVKIVGATVVAINDYNNVYITDGVDIIYIYGPSYTVEVGETYDFSGVFVWYYNAPELIGDDAHPLRADASDAVAVDAPVTVAANIQEIITAQTVPSTENPFEFQTYQVTAKIYYEESWGNYCVFLVPTDYDFGAALPDGQTKPNGDSILIYYQSDDDVLKALHGLEVTVNIMLNGWRTDKSLWYANFFGTDADVTVNFATDADAVAAALDSIVYPSEIIEGTTLDMPATLYGVGLTYASDNETVINSTTGVVDLSTLTTQVTVTITVTATKGTETDTKTIEITVGELPTSTIAEVIAAANGSKVKAEGVVYYITQEGYFIQDDTDKIFVYTGSSTITVAIGDEIEIVATRGEYGGAPQLTSTESVTVLSSGNDATQTPIVFEPGVTTVDFGEIYTVQALIVVDASNNNRVYFYDGEDVIGYLRYKSPVGSEAALQAVEGSIVTVDLLYYRSDGDNLVFFFDGDANDIEVYVMTDAEKVAADKALLDFGGSVYEATDVNLPATGTNGSTITWAITADAGTNATLVDGTLSLGAVTEEATVEITATITCGTETDTKVFTYTLKNLVLINIEDIPTQTLGDVVSVTGYVYAVTTNGFFVQDATGKIFVYTYAVTYNVGDEVELTGAVGQYAGSFQLTNLENITAALSTGNDVTQTALPFELGVTVLEAGYTYQIIGTVDVVEGEYTDYFIDLNETDSFEIYYRSPSTSLDAVVALDETYVVINMIYYNGGDTFVYAEGTTGINEINTDLSIFHTQTDTAWDIPEGETVYVQGIVTGNSYDGLFIQDAAGNGLFLYRPDNDSTTNVGDEIIYFGTLGSYNGTRQLTSGADVIAVLSTGNAVTPVTMTPAELGIIDQTSAGQLITITGLVIDHFDGSHVFLTAVTAGDVEIRYYTNFADWLPDVYEAGDTLPAITANIYNFRDGYIQLDCLEIELTDAQAQQLDADALPTTLTLTENWSLPTAEYGSTYAITAVTGDTATQIDWTTTPGTLIVDTSADATGITVTVTVSIGTETDVTVDITVEISSAAALYSTGFETEDGFTAATTYSSGLIINGWTVVDGTVTATDASTSDLHLQMRDYSDGTPSYAEYTDGSTIITTVVFNSYTNTAGTQLTVQFSTDGTTWSTGTVIDLTTSDATYTVDSDITDATYVRFTETTATESSQRVNLDDVFIY